MRAEYDIGWLVKYIPSNVPRASMALGQSAQDGVWCYDRNIALQNGKGGLSLKTIAAFGRHRRRVFWKKDLFKDFNFLVISEILEIPQSVDEILEV